MDQYSFILFGLLLACSVLAVATAVLSFFLLHSRKRWKDLIFTDHITGGGTLAWFEIQYKKLVQEMPAGTYFMAVLDINNFKMMNDTFGRESGNRILCHVYRMIKSCLGKDEITSRLYSDNFGILLKNTDKQTVVERLSDMAVLINDFNFQREKKYFIPIVFGITTVGEANQEFYSIQEQAKVACQKAKRQTGDGMIRYAYFSEEDRDLIIRLKDLENKMENALANKEFLVYLQPKYNLKTDQAEGAEALVRWMDPQSGMVQPDDFVSLFERNGFIQVLDLYVFREICQCIRCWLDHGITPVVISVNLSRCHLNNPGFLNQFEQIRQEYHVPAKFLEFELTESMVFENMDFLNEILDQIHQIGYRCSLDDFGSGFSSLNILRVIPVDALKLDKMFFEEGGHVANKRGKLIVQSVVELAHRLGIQTVSEGVENWEQVQFLREIDGDMIQGYVYSKPIPISAFEELVYGGSYYMQG